MNTAPPLEGSELTPRPVPAGVAPRLGVVLVALGERVAQEAAVAHLLPICRECRAVLVVVRRDSAVQLVTSTRSAADLTLVVAPADHDAADLRSLGMREMQAGVIAFTDDGAALLTDWSELLPRLGLLLGVGGGELPTRNLAGMLTALRVRQPEPE